MPITRYSRKLTDYSVMANVQETFLYCHVLQKIVCYSTLAFKSPGNFIHTNILRMFPVGQIPNQDGFKFILRIFIVNYIANDARMMCYHATLVRLNILDESMH